MHYAINYNINHLPECLNHEATCLWRKAERTSFLTASGASGASVILPPPPVRNNSLRLAYLPPGHCGLEDKILIIKLYGNYQCVVIGSMNLVCSHCKALKYKNEANGLCCANGKVKLIQLDPPPEPLYSLVSGIGTDSIHFLTHIQQYNNCFQMTSFGATNAVRENFMPTFKIQGQIYHRAGSLLPVSDSDNKFLQIYFMGNSPQEIDLRCAHNNLVKRSIVEQLQTLFHQHNQLIILKPTDSNK
ncbi:uncharacterized protein LOC143204483 [Rhynchophorus ferrugineus]|uniref:uncharacterized protein LOC143204483 n=1 Tax=Rhynchophorus ferrugineus TaxID=354439 RepID=UPI003FCD58FF